MTQEMTDTDNMTMRLLNDRYGQIDIPPPDSPKERNDEEGKSALVRQILNIIYEELLEAKNHKLIRSAIIIPMISHMINAIRPFILLLSSLFLLSIIMTAIVLIVLILKRS